MRSRIYTLGYLESVRDLKKRRSDCKITQALTSGNLISLFPVRVHDIGVNNQWAFYCLCGNFCIQDAGAVSRGANKSCGCLNGQLNKNKTLLKTLKETLSPLTSYTLVREGSTCRSRDWGFTCDICGVSKNNLCRYDVLTEGKRFCKCSSNYIGTRAEVIVSLEEAISKSSWNLISFPENYTYKNSCRVDLECKVCGEPKNMSYNNAIRGRGCYNCANIATTNRLSKDLDWFIEEANLKHNYKYDYSSSVYNGAREHIEIICHEHKEPYHFWQSPDNHKNKGKGCPECKRLRLKYVSFHKAKVEENKETYKKLNSGVYLFELGGFNKIGLSCNDHKRSLEVKKASKLDVKVLGYLSCNLYEAFYLENFLHKRYEPFRHCSEVEWVGHTECFDLTEAQVEEILFTLGGRYDNNSK